MDRLELSIKVLENQWADLLLVINEHDIMLHFERVPNDPLYNLLEGTMRIKDNRDSTIVFHNGPQQEYLSIKKLGDSLCRIEVRHDYVDLPIKRFYKMILKMFDVYTFSFSKDEYTNNWNAFPGAELEKLRILYHALQPSP